MHTSRVFLNLAPDIATSVAKSLLRPVIRLLLGSRMSFQQFMDVAKVVFVELATEEIERAEKKANISRVSLMTGLQRRDVSRIQKSELEAIESGPSVLTRIMNHWEQKAEYCTASGQPRVLTYGDDSSEFSKLVREVSKDTKPGTVQFEMERIGVAKRTARGLKLAKQSLKQVGDPERQFALLSKEFDSIIQIAIENMPHDEEPPHHHVRTEYDNIYEADLPKIRDWFQREGTKFHRRGRAFLSKFDKDLNYKPGKQAGRRVQISSYGYVEEVVDD